MNLIPCGSCGRKFIPESLAKHEKICESGKPALRESSIGSTGKRVMQRDSSDKTLDLIRSVPPVNNPYASYSSPQ